MLSDWLNIAGWYLRWSPPMTAYELWLIKNRPTITLCRSSTIHYQYLLMVIAQNRWLPTDHRLPLNIIYRLPLGNYPSSINSRSSVIVINYRSSIIVINYRSSTIAIKYTFSIVLFFNCKKKDHRCAATITIRLCLFIEWLRFEFIDGVNRKLYDSESMNILIDFFVFSFRETKGRNKPRRVR